MNKRDAGLVQALVISIAAALLFFLTIELRRSVTPPGMVWLGWTMYDMPTYFANAREVFENGNGLVYANPYALPGAAPRIYLHLPITLMGWLWKSGMSLEAVDRLLLLVFGSAMLALPWAIARHLLGDGWRGRGGYAVAILGGNFGILAALLLPSAAPAGLLVRHAAVESNWGAWCMNTFRNLWMSTECVYHVLFFGTVVLAMNCRWRLAICGVVLAWLSHPFTALELSGILGSWQLLEVVLAFRGGEKALVRRVTLRLAGILAATAAGLGYYMVFLPLDPDYRETAALWTNAKVLDYSFIRWRDLPAAYGPLVLGLAWPLCRTGRAALASDPVQRLCACWLAVALLAAHNEKFLGPAHSVQPLHFARGYDHLVLVLWCFCLLREVGRSFPRAEVLAAATLGLVMLADTAVFQLRFARGIAIPNDNCMARPGQQGEVLRHLDAMPGHLVVLVVESDPTKGLNFLVATHTPHIPAMGHITNQPRTEQRMAAYGEWLKTASAQVVEQAFHPDLLLFDSAFVQNPPARCLPQGFEEILPQPTPGYRWFRRAAPGAQALLPQSPGAHSNHSAGAPLPGGQ